MSARAQFLLKEKNTNMHVINKTNFMLTISANTDNVEDELVGTMIYNGSIFTYGSQQILNLLRKAKASNTMNSQTRKAIDYSGKSYNSKKIKIVVLLESPSDDEYKTKNQNSNSPAFGLTGGRINSQFLPLISRSVCNTINSFKKICNNGSEIEIILVNAIRYQCDLGKKGNRKIIKFVFNHLWTNMNFSKDLYSRLNYINPDLIIDACSHDLKALIVWGNVNCKLICHTDHPITWNKNTTMS